MMGEKKKGYLMTFQIGIHSSQASYKVKLSLNTCFCQNVANTYEFLRYCAIKAPGSAVCRVWTELFGRRGT